MPPERRAYNQYCALAHALDVVGERWTLLIVRDLLLGPRRYSDLLSGLPGITTNLLAKRLRELEELELVERIRTGATDAHAYRLTERGAALEPAVHALAKWAWATMGSPERGEARRFDWLLFSMRGRYRGGETLRAELVVDGAPYRIVLTPARAEVARGDVSSPELRVTGGALPVGKLLLAPPAHPRVPDGVAIEGDAALLRTLLGAFDKQDLVAALNRN